MKLKTDLPDGGRIFIESSEGQTHISSESGGQSQSNSFSTGEWKQPPQLFKLSDGLVLQVNGELEQYFQIRGSQMQSLDKKPALDGADSLDLSQAGDDEGPREMEPMEPMRPMEPMKPMKPMS